MDIKEKEEITYKNNPKNKILLLTAALYLLYFIYGLTNTIIGPLIPAFMNQYKISMSTSGLIAMLLGIGGVTSLIASLTYADRIRKSLLIKITFSVFIISVFLVALEPVYILLLTIFFFFGASCLC